MSSLATKQHFKFRTDHRHSISPHGPAAASIVVSRGGRDPGFSYTRTHARTHARARTYTHTHTRHNPPRRPKPLVAGRRSRKLRGPVCEAPYARMQRRSSSATALRPQTKRAADPGGRLPGGPSQLGAGGQVNHHDVFRRCLARNHSLPAKAQLSTLTRSAEVMSLKQIRRVNRS